MNTKILSLILVFLLFTPSLGNTAEAKSSGTTNTAAQVPDWVKRVDFGIDAGKDQKFHAYFETVQPLYQDSDLQNTVFVEPRVSYFGGKGVYNIGLGYRRLSSDNSVLLGGNIFYDYQTYHRHYRLGLGEEAFIKLIELRANQYFALSPARVIQDNASGTSYERAMNGADMEVGIPLPYMNWVKIYGGGYWFDHKYGSSEWGWKSRLEITPFKLVTINLMTNNDNYNPQEYSVDARISLAWGAPGYKKEDSCNIGFSDKAYPDKIDYSGQVLKRVEREYTIRTEKYTKTATGGVTIEVKRGN